jgi:hypothetical protein
VGVYLLHQANGHDGVEAKVRTQDNTRYQQEMLGLKIRTRDVEEPNVTARLSGSL